MRRNTCNVRFFILHRGHIEINSMDISNMYRIDKLMQNNAI